MEIINDAQVEPHRLRALVKLIGDLQEPRRQEVQDLLQPLKLVEGKSSSKEPQLAARNTYRIAVDCNLVTDAEKNTEKTTRSLVSSEDIAAMQLFQRHMQHVVLNVTEQHQSNYLFNLYSAWYAVQNERVFHELVIKGYDGPFNTEVFPDSVEERPFNTTKFNAWRKWAAFLGLGWIWRVSTREILLPDATVRLRNRLGILFQEDEQISFGLFMERLAITCPELDGGVLFNYCWQASRGAEQRGNRVSLMVSTGLRTLHSLGVIKLIEQADALNIWHLYPAVGNPWQQITHIQRLGV